MSKRLPINALALVLTLHAGTFASEPLPTAAVYKAVRRGKGEKARNRKNRNRGIY